MVIVFDTKRCLMAHNLKSIKQKFKEKGVYYTPQELVKLMYTYVDN